VKQLFIIPFFILLAAICSCKKDNPVAAKVSPGGDDSSTVYYQLNTLGLHQPRSGEYFILWTKTSPDTTWEVIAPLKIIYTSPEDSTMMVGKFLLNRSLDSIRDVLVTVEQSNTPQKPGLVLCKENFRNLDSSKKLLTFSLESKSVLGDFYPLLGNIVFTSKSSDPLAYTHEFYLMNFSVSDYKPSLQSLPATPQGWEYGLWVADTNFTPHEYFFYGLFSTPTGHDSDSTNDFFSFPGGSKPQQMNMPSGNIIVTLEPLLYGDQLKYHGPSPFTLLQFNRIRDIQKDSNYQMTNVSEHGVPSGSITFRRY